MNKGISLNESMPLGNCSYRSNYYMSFSVIISPMHYIRHSFNMIILWFIVQRKAILTVKNSKTTLLLQRNYYYYMLAHLIKQFCKVQFFIFLFFLRNYHVNPSYSSYQVKDTLLNHVVILLTSWTNLWNAIPCFIKFLTVLFLPINNLGQKSLSSTIYDHF